MNRHASSALVLLGALALGACSSSTPPAPKHTAITTEKLEPYSCGTIQRLNTYSGIFLASQPAAEDFKQAKEGGVKTVINLRKEGENKDFDEPKLIGELGLAYVNIPFSSPDELTDAVFEKARAELNQAQRPILLHCHSGNRAGAIWLAWRALDGKLSYEDALAEAKQVGLKAPALEQKAKDYIERTHSTSH